MRHSFLRSVTVIGAGLLAWSSAEAVAHAAACPATNVVYVTGSSAIKPFLAGLAAKLTPTLNIIYKSAGSCVGVNALATPAPLTGTASQWDSAGAETSCDLPGDKNADVGASDIFAATCNPAVTVPADVGDFYGPNQIMNLIVPIASTETVISADAAFLLWAFGKDSQVDPWKDGDLYDAVSGMADPAKNTLYRRNKDSGTQGMINAAINAMNPVKLDSNRWKGIDTGGSGTVLSKVGGSTTPNSTIGILASDLADGARDKVKILAYQHTNQLDGYWPDMKPTTFDKINVRDGHYPIWGPIHFFAKKDSAGLPAVDGAKKLIGYFTGKEALPTGVDLLKIEVESGHTVPQCAMYVTRSTELGDFSDYTDPSPCHCAFDVSATKATPASCKACTADTGCDAATQKCSHGYCEAK